MHPLQNSDKPFLHFSFLRDIKVNGIYLNSFDNYFSRYPFIRKDHLHDFYSVLLFTRGKGVLGLNSEKYYVQAGTICLIAPGQIHSFEEIQEMEGYLFFFCQDFYVEEFSFLRLLNVFSCTSRLASNVCNPCIQLKDEEFKHMNDLIDSIEKEYHNHSASDNSSVIIRSLLNIMLLRISTWSNSKMKESENGDVVFIHELSRLVDSYFIKEHHVGFYTSAFNISEKHMNEMCNKHFNCGLKKILKDRLMQEARKLLLSSELSVSEISYKLNFEDNSYFNKVFKSETGLTPKRFRDIHRRLLP
jgi:AraC family transcriptional regulator, transcriptional activator of pobA